MTAMKFENIFYGCGRDGYTVLGSSTGDEQMDAEATALCQSLGTQGYASPEDDRPFLFQRVIGDRVFMGCGRTGEKDSFGRGTLFFHILVTGLPDATAAGVSALDAYRKGLFRDRLPSGKIGLTEVELHSSPQGVDDCKIELPAVISCRRADNLRVAELMGTRAVATNWTTFSWCVPEGFETFGIDCSYSHLKVRRGMTSYLIWNGELCKIPCVETLEEKNEVPVAAAGFKGDSADAHSALGDVGESSVAKAVVFAGVAGLLVGACVMWCLSAKIRHVDEVKPVVDETKPVFDMQNNRLTDTDKGLSNLWTLAEKTNRDFVPVLKKIHHYISFVNENFTDEKKKRKNGNGK